MARTGPVAARAESLLGRAVVATSPVAGGDICTATRVRLSDGSSALVKTRPHAPADFFTTEARGLRRLAATGTVAVPEVLAAEPDCLVLAWVETGRPGAEAAEDLGRSLAGLHRAGPVDDAGPVFGDEAGDGYIGTLPLPNKPAPGWPEFYATRRLLPYLKLAVDRRRIGPADADAVEAVVRRLTTLAGPEEPPALLHGDLWSGNLLWGVDGRVWLVDPAAYAGHRETDLAMLALFGCPSLERVIEAYQQVAPLAEGWEDRVPLHQLFPLLVHAAMFGGGYGARAGEAARSLA
jgi:fructosamine-3-kinase